MASGPATLLTDPEILSQTYGGHLLVLGDNLGILDDSGQPIAPTTNRWATWRDAWKLATPPGCNGCDTDPSAYVHYYQSTFPDVTFAILSFNPDPVISTFMGITPTTFSTELGGMLAANSTAVFSTAG